MSKKEKSEKKIGFKRELIVFGIIMLVIFGSAFVNVIIYKITSVKINNPSSSIKNKSYDKGEEIYFDPTGKVKDCNEDNYWTEDNKKTTCYRWFVITNIVDEDANAEYAEVVLDHNIDEVEWNKDSKKSLVTTLSDKLIKKTSKWKEVVTYEDQELASTSDGSSKLLLYGGRTNARFLEYNDIYQNLETSVTEEMTFRDFIISDIDEVAMPKWLLKNTDTPYWLNNAYTLSSNDSEKVLLHRTYNRGLVISKKGVEKINTDKSRTYGIRPVVRIKKKWNGENNNIKSDVKKEEKKTEQIEEQSLEWFKDKYGDLIDTIFTAFDYVYTPAIDTDKNDIYVYDVVALQLAKEGKISGGEYIPKDVFQDKVYEIFGIKDFMYEEGFDNNTNQFRVPIMGRVGLIPEPRITNVEYDGNIANMTVIIDYSDGGEVLETSEVIFEIAYDNGNYFIKTIRDK